MKSALVLYAVVTAIALIIASIVWTAFSVKADLLSLFFPLAILNTLALIWFELRSVKKILQQPGVKPQLPS